MMKMYDFCVRNVFMKNMKSIVGISIRLDIGAG